MPLPDQSTVFKAYREALPRDLSGLLLKLKLYSVFEVLRYISQNKARILGRQDMLRSSQAIVLLQQMHLPMSERPKIQVVIDELLREFDSVPKDESPSASQENQAAVSRNSYSPETDDALFIKALPSSLAVFLTERNLLTRSDILGYMHQNFERIRSGRDPISKDTALILLKKIRSFLTHSKSLDQLRQSLIQGFSASGDKPTPTSVARKPAKNVRKPEMAQQATPGKTEMPAPLKKRAAERLDDAGFSQMLKTTNLPSQYKDACPVCHVVYRLDNLSKHIKTGHGMLVVNCKYCGIRVDAGNLANHLLRKHHGELGDVFIPPVSRLNPHIQVQVEPPPDADGPADTYEFFCRAMPAEVVERLEAQNIQNISALLKFMDEHKAEICLNTGLFLADEAVLMLRRMMSLGILDPRVTYLLRDVITSMKYKVDNLRKPRRFKIACPVCGKMYAIEWLQRHVWIKHPRGKMQCPFCSKKIGAQSLCNHLSQMHNEKLLSVYAPTKPELVVPSLRLAAQEPDRVIEKETLAPSSTHTEKAHEHDSWPAQPVHSMPAHMALLSHTRPADLREFHPLARIRRARNVKISSEIDDRAYFIFQASRVKTERANQVHESTLAALREYLAQAGVDVGETFLIDAYAEISGQNIFEVKSINNHNEKSQIRHAVAQLYEYRFVYGFKEARLWLVLSGRPETGWILEYLVHDRGINVLWFKDGCLRGPSLGELTVLLQKAGHS